MRGTHRHSIPSTRLVAAVLATLALPAIDALAHGQESPPLEERRKIVVRGVADPAVEIRADLGRRGYLGVMLLPITPELRAHLGAPEDRGVLVSKVVDGSPAERAGLHVGDVLAAVDGRPIRVPLHLQMPVARGEEGEEVELEVWRDGGSLDLRVALETRERSQLDLAPLVGHRALLAAPPSLELVGPSDDDVELDVEWVEDVVGRVGRRLTDSAVLEQLEAMRVERRGLQEKLDRMEERLRELEVELRSLADDPR